MKFDKKTDTNSVLKADDIVGGQTFDLKRQRTFLFGTIIFLLYCAHAFTLGPSDDEAYYWALSNTFRFGYAFHPPMVAWMIMLSRFLFEQFLPAIVVLRLPAVICVGLMMYSFSIMAPTVRGLIFLLSFAGFYSAAFMMVPDMPLYLGLSMMMTTLYPCFFRPDTKLRPMSYLKLFSGILFCMFSKYSAVLWGPILLFMALRSKSNRGRLLIVMSSGFLAAVIVLVIGFQQNGFGSLVYQFSERHAGAHLDFKRYLRFFFLELLISGPFFWVYFLSGRKILKDKALTYGMLWAAVPMFVFGMQPLWSDFKIHWLFAGILPLFAMASVSGEFLSTKFAKFQTIYGCVLLLVLVIATRLPIISLFRSHILHAESNPLLDVSNDLRGYDVLKIFFNQLPMESIDEEVIGGRYQTASQALFAIGSAGREIESSKSGSDSNADGNDSTVDNVSTDTGGDTGNARRLVTLYPVSQKEAAEWPAQSSLIPITDHFRIIRPFYYVSDERYTALPVLSNGTCNKVFESAESRYGTPGKAVYVHHCILNN